MYVDRESDGFTLVELVLAIAVLAMATIATLRVVDQSRVVIGGAEDRILAQLAASNRAEGLVVYAADSVLASVVQVGGRGFVLSTDIVLTTGGLLRASVRAVSPLGNVASQVTYIVPDQP